MVFLSVVFWGRRGPVSFRAVKGEGGPVSFGVGSVRRLFLFWGCERELRRVSFGVVFCGEWRRVSFGVVLSCSVGNGGESASGAVKGE